MIGRMHAKMAKGVWFWKEWCVLGKECICFGSGLGEVRERRIYALGEEGIRLRRGGYGLGEEGMVWERRVWFGRGG